MQTPTTPVLRDIVLIGGGLACQAILEGWGGSKLFLVCVLVGVLPVLAAGIIGSVNASTLPPATWIGALSPLAAPGYATAVLIHVVSVHNGSVQIVSAVPIRPSSQSIS